MFNISNPTRIRPMKSGLSRHFHLSSLFLQTGLHTGLARLFEGLRSAVLTVSLHTNDDQAGVWVRS